MSFSGSRCWIKAISLGFLEKLPFDTLSTCPFPFCMDRLIESDSSSAAYRTYHTLHEGSGSCGKPLSKRTYLGSFTL